MSRFVRRDFREFLAKLASPAEMTEMDRLTIGSGIPSLELMERAGRAALEEMLAHPALKNLSDARTVILCGPGNNGGDGLVLARLLIESGAIPKVVMVSAERYSPDCLAQMTRYVMSAGELLFVGEAPKALSGLKHANLSEKDFYYTVEQSEVVLDCLFGTGQKGAPEGQAAHLIRVLSEVLKQEAEPPVVVSIDTPSGIDGGTGAVFEPAVRADVTISIELFKRGMFQYPARGFCGEMTCVSIGLDTSGETEFSLIGPAVARELLKRPGDMHKGQAGSVYVLGGSRTMPGAPVLAAEAAITAGAGVVSMAALPGERAVFTPPEIILHFPQSKKSQSFADSALRSVIKRLEDCDCVVLGPGLGLAADTGELVLGLLKWIAAEKYPAVLDADALNVLSRAGKSFRLPSCILTPHPGEAARLLGCSTKEIQADRFSAARRLSEKFAAVVVLKGAGTVVYAGKEGFVNQTGGPFMATAGSGDVLSGIIGAFYAQARHLPAPAVRAACAGVFVHGSCGDDSVPVTASQLIRNLPLCLSTLRASSD